LPIVAFPLEGVSKPKLGLIRDRVPMDPQTKSNGIIIMTICHNLPCSIDYKGRAPVDTYFRPAVISTSETDDGEQPQYQAAMFRGRGLLAARAVPVAGLILQPDSVSDDAGRRNNVVVGTFHEIVEWHHTHQIDAIPRHGSRVQKAKDWMEVAAALHAPIKCDTKDDDDDPKAMTKNDP
jgi:hypothetical protein